jgi:hypothetical protein
MHSSSEQIHVGPLGKFLALLVRQGIPFGGFLLALAFSWVQFLSPLLEIRASQSWPEVECRPLDTASDSDLHYTYEFAGQRFESDRLNLFASPPENLTKLQEKFRRGEPVTGYVDPSNPDIAVLSREDSHNESLGRIVLGLFVIVFCSGVTAAWLTGMDKWTAAKAGRGKRVLPITRFCECTVYATLVNSFVSVFFFVFLSVPGSFLVKAFSLLLLIPFALLGLLMIYSTSRNFALIFTEQGYKAAAGPK